MTHDENRMTRNPTDRRMYARNRRDEELINTVVRKALRDTFMLIGVDINDPATVDEFRADLRFGRQIRKLVGHGMLAAVSVAAAAIAVSAWTGIVAAIRGHQ